MSIQAQGQGFVISDHIHVQKKGDKITAKLTIGNKELNCIPGKNLEKENPWTVDRDYVRIYKNDGTIAKPKWTSFFVKKNDIESLRDLVSIAPKRLLGGHSQGWFESTDDYLARMINAIEKKPPPTVPPQASVVPMLPKGSSKQQRVAFNENVKVQGLKGARGEGEFTGKVYSEKLKEGKLVQKRPKQRDMNTLLKDELHLKLPPKFQKFGSVSIDFLAIAKKLAPLNIDKEKSLLDYANHGSNGNLQRCAVDILHEICAIQRKNLVRSTQVHEETGKESYTYAIR